MLKIKFGMIHLKYGTKIISSNHFNVNFKDQEIDSISSQDIVGMVSSEVMAFKINLFNKKTLKKPNKQNNIKNTLKISETKNLKF